MFHYSNRLSWNFLENPVSEELERRRSVGASLCDLTLSNPTQAFSSYPHQLISEAFADLKDYSYTPAPFGNVESRRSIGSYYQARGISVDPGRILLTASTSEAYSILFKLFCNAGDEVLVPIPSYPLFEYLAKLENVRLVPYRLWYDGGWSIDFDHLIDRLSPTTRAIIIVNPNNPTGSFLKIWELERLITIAADHKLPIVSDEVFMDYSFSENLGRIQSITACSDVLTISLNGLSKAAGMPQMKLAWMVLNGPHADCQEAKKRLELILDTYLSVGTPVQLALPRLLAIGFEFQKVILATTRSNLRSAVEILAGSSAHVLHTEGGWSAVIQLPNVIPEEDWVTNLLREHNVVVQPGYFFDMASEAFIVVSLITPPAQFQLGMEAIRHATDRVIRC